jgi:hypothetical protein
VRASEDGAARRLVAVLEGGYSAEGLAVGAATLVTRMLTEGGASTRGPDQARAEGALVTTLREAHAVHWPVLARE